MRPTSQSAGSAKRVSPLDSSFVSASPAVEIIGLTKRYDAKAVVDQLSLTASTGALTAVLGPNGAGKTTTIECCEGLRHPDGGTIRVLGLDPVADARALRPRVGVMLQDGGLPTAVRALEMLRHVAKMYANPRSVDELTDRLGLASFGRTTVRRLSGGQRQRLALAAAIVGRPEVIFLDEPSAGMDPQSRHAVWELIRELRSEGASIILTTHLMDEAAQLADDVVIVDHGKVIARGSVPELTASRNGQTLNLSFSTQPTDAFVSGLGSAIKRLLPHAPVCAITTMDDGRLQLSGEITPQTLVAVTTWCAEQNMKIDSLDLGDRTLEDVFLDLTGRTLR